VGLKGLLPDQQSEDTAFRTYLKRLNQEKTDAEMQRLLYVACTRAERHLILSGDLSHTLPPNSWVTWLMTLLPLQDALPQSTLTITDDSQTFYEPQSLEIPIRTSSTYRSIISKRPAPTTPALLSASIESLAEQQRKHSGSTEIQEHVATLLKHNIAPLKGQENEYFRISPSTVHKLFQCPQKYYYQEILKLPEFPGKLGERSEENVESSRLLEPTEIPRDLGKQRGTILHRLFEEQIFERQQSDDGIVASVNQSLDLMGISPQARRDMQINDVILQAAHSYRQSGLPDLLARSPQVYREYPFLLRLSQVEISGTLDVLFFDPDREQWTILDYKSNEIPAERVPDEIRRHGYDLQMQLYALAVSHVLHTDFPRVMLFFTSPGTLYDTIDLSPAALNQVTHTIEQFFQHLQNDRLHELPDSASCDECRYRDFA
jgi:ATP-dependent exoDNAse (exonuclease V) beta subunit